MSADYRQGCIVTAALSVFAILLGCLVGAIFDISPLWPAISSILGCAVYDWRLLRRGQ